MMLKEKIKEKGIKISEISRKADIPYSTINDIINGKTDLDRVSFGVVRKIADVIDMSIDEMTRLIETEKMELEGDYQIIIKNKSYYLTKEKTEHYLCKVNRLNSYYIRFISESVIREIKEREEMDRKWRNYIISCEKINH